MCEAGGLIVRNAFPRNASKAVKGEYVDWRGVVQMTKLGILGLGKMGSAFALNLLSKGNEVHVYNRSKERLRELVAKGAKAHPSPYELGKSVDVIVTSLTDQDVVESIVMGKDGALHGMKRGSLWVEMSTIDPDASIRQADQAKMSGVDRLDAPVIGNPDMAAQGHLALLVGGDEIVFEKNRELLNQLGSTVIYLGKAGSGHKMKLILNLHLGTIGLAFSEAFVLSQKLGFEPGVFVDAFNKTVQKNYFSEVKGPLIAKGDYSPLFTVNMLVKDLTLAENQATRQKVALPVGSLVKQLFMTCVNQGKGEMDFSSVALTMQKLNGIEPHSRGSQPR
jgi:3-hydroxyisobutyrate dehydrogenase-like beta-hydroxyacid dehydrogenase